MTETSRSRLLLVSLDEIFAERVTTALTGHFQISQCEPTVDKLAAVLEASPPEICLIDVEDGKWDGTPNVDLVATVRSRRENLPIIIATHDVSLNTVIPSMRSGANDVSDKDFAPDELVALLERQVQRRPVRRGEEHGRMYAVVSRRGGIGATTVALSLALDLACRLRPDRKILLLDFSYPPPVTSDLLSLTAKYFVADAIRDISRLDATLVENAFLRMQSVPLYLLPLAPTEEIGSHISPNDVFNLISVLRTYFSCIIVDLNFFWSSNFAERIVTDCDRAIVCCDQSITTLHATAAFLDEVKKHSGAEPDFALAVTRHTDELQPKAEDLRRALGGIAPTYVIPYDRVRLDLARNAGEPILEKEPSTPFGKAIRNLADAEINQRGDLAMKERRTQRWQRLRRLFSVGDPASA